MTSNYLDYQNKRRHTPVGLALCGAALLLAGCGGGSSSQPVTPQTYTITDLGVLPGDVVSSAAALNNSGDVVGTAADGLPPIGPPRQTPPITTRYFLFTNNTLNQINIPLPNSPVAINDQKHILLTSGSKEALLYSNGTTTAFNPLIEVTSGGFGGLNNEDQVVGDIQTSGGGVHAALLTGTTLTDLGVSPGGKNSDARGLNDKGQVVGSSDFATNQPPVSHAAMFKDGTVTDLGVLPGDLYSSGSHINNNGQIIGDSLTAGANYSTGDGIHAFLYSGGKMISLGTLPGDSTSSAVSINDQGQVVGVSMIPGPDFEGSGGPQNHYFLYTQGRMTNLQSLLPAASGWTLTGVMAINNAGQICGTGTHNGLPRAFLMTPQ